MALRALLLSALCALLPARALCGPAEVVTGRAGGVFALVSNGSDAGRCAGSVNHRGAWVAGRGGGVWELAHGGIDHVAETCAGGGVLRVYGGGFGSERVAEVAGSAGMKGVVEAGAFWAGEAGRECGEWRVPAGSVFAFVWGGEKGGKGVQLGEGEKTVLLEGGRDYMVAVYEGLEVVCVYGKEEGEMSKVALGVAEGEKAEEGNEGEGLVKLPAVAAGGEKKEDEEEDGEEGEKAGEAGSGAEGEGGAGDSFFSKGRNVAIVAAAAAAVVVALAVCICCVCLRRRGGGDGDAYYKFDGGSARNSGSLAEQRATPWGVKRSAKKLPDVEDAAAADARGARGSESGDSGSGIDAPMIDTMEARSLSAGETKKEHAYQGKGRR